MTLQRVQGTAPLAEYEFLLSDHQTRKGSTIDADLVRLDQYLSTYKILKAGTVMGKVTATGLYGPVKKTTLAAQSNLGATTSTLTSAAFFQVGDSVLLGSETKTLTAIDYATNVVTHTALAGQQNAGVTVKEDNGLETAEGILMNTVDLTDGDVAAAILTHGVVKEARLFGSNTLTKADLPQIQFR